MLQRNNLKKELMELTLPGAFDNYMTALTPEGKSPETILWYRKKLTRRYAAQATRHSGVGSENSFENLLSDRVPAFGSSHPTRPQERGREERFSDSPLH